MNASKASVRRATIADAKRLGKRLRRPDRKEILSNSGRRPLNALEKNIATSKKAFAIDDEGRILGLFGVIDAVSSVSGRVVGRPWLIGSEELFRRYRRRFLTEYPEWLSTISEGYDVLENYVLEENTAHIKWLKWAGFEFKELHQGFGSGRANFWRFELDVSTV
jgi:hypothetical protein